MNNFKYFIAAFAGFLCLATGATAEQSVGSIDLSGSPTSKIGYAGGAVRGAGVAHIKGLPPLKYGDSLFHTGSVAGIAAKKLFSSAIHKQVNNDLTGAIADYLAAVQMDDHDPAVHWYLGPAYLAAGKTGEAMQEFAKPSAAPASVTLMYRQRIK
jgi:hypothetical protein